MANLPPNQSQILSGGYSPWQAPLAALFSGISAAAQPGGFQNFGMGAQQGIQNFQQGQQGQQMMDLRRMQIEQAQEEQRRANQEAEQAQAQKDRIKQSLARFTGSPTSVQPVGNYGAATGGIQTASGTPGGGQLAAMFGGDQQKAALFTEYADAYPEQAYQMLVERGFAEPEKPKAGSEIGQIMADVDAGFITPEQAQERIDKMNYIAPQQAGSSELWEPYVEPGTGRTGQRNTKTHRIDWDPGQSGAGIQLDTDHDGNPDVTIGGKGMAPPTATQATHNIKGLLLSQGLDDIAKTNFDNVSPAKMAAAEAATEKGGALGEWGSNLFMNDDEKRLMGAQGAIQEAVISATTGAAYSETQKRNMRAKYVILPTDSPTRRAEKTKAAAEFLAQEDRNSNNSRVQTEQGGATNPADMSDDELMKALGQ